MGLFDFFKKDKESKEQQQALDEGLQKTKTSFFDQLSKAVVGKSTVDEAVLDDLETLLVHADVGIDTTVKVIDRIEMLHVEVRSERRGRQGSLWLLPLCPSSIRRNYYTFCEPGDWTTYEDITDTYTVLADGHCTSDAASWTT